MDRMLKNAMLTALTAWLLVLLALIAVAMSALFLEQPVVWLLTVGMSAVLGSLAGYVYETKR